MAIGSLQLKIICKYGLFEEKYSYTISCSVLIDNSKM